MGSFVLFVCVGRIFVFFNSFKYLKGVLLILSPDNCLLKQRDGKVIAKKSKDVSGKTLKGFIKQNVKKGSTMSTDEWGGYKGLAPHYKHVLVAHGKGEYVNGIAHTNGMENFWSLLKRGVIGQYHWVSNKYLDLYVTEFSYRYNNRNTENIFDVVMKNTVQLTWSRK